MSEGLARNTLYSSIAGLIYSLGRFLTTVVLARIVGVHDTGVVNYVLWLVALVGALTDMGAYATLSRYLPETSRHVSPGSADPVLRYLFWPFAVLAVIPPAILVGLALAGMAGAGRMGASLLSLDADILPFVALLYCVQVLSNFALGYLQGMQQFRRMVVFAAAAMSLQLLVVGVAGFIWGASGALIGYTIGCAVPALLCVGFLRTWRPLPESLRERVNRFAFYSWAGTIASALVWGRLEMAFLNRYYDSAAVGLYSVAYTLASLAVQAPLLLTGALLPYFSEIAGAKDNGKLASSLQTGTRFLAFVTLPLTCVTAAVAPQLLSLFFGRDFAVASVACVIVIIGTGLWACSSVATNLLAGLERSDFIFAAHLSGAVLSVVLSVVLIPSLGIEGAALTRAAAQFYVFALTWWFVAKRMKFAMPTAEFLRMLSLAAASGGVAFLVTLVIPGLIGIPAAFMAGGVSYVLMVRLTGVIPLQDVRAMRLGIDRLPSMLGLILHVSLSMVAPSVRR